jgi:hypothetical protein
VIAGQYWYSATGSPLDKAQANYMKALATGTKLEPPFVNYAPRPPDGAQEAGIEVKSAWRPLSSGEMQSRRFVTAMVRYYEQPDGKTSCYCEAVWGLVGMHLISFSVDAPWVIWSTFEQADNILTADGRPTEDTNGNRIVSVASPTTPLLSSDPNVINPTVTKNGDYCGSPGARLYFRENPHYGTMPSDGNICVNGRWSAPEPIFIKANTDAHSAIATYLQKYPGFSPLTYYKLVGAQGVPVDFKDREGTIFSTAVSYRSANATIETDYSLGNFTGDLVKGVPSNVLLKGGQPAQYINTRLLPFQSNQFDFSKMQMGGCAGCHGFAAQMGSDLSFALGDNATAPEPTDAFNTPNGARNYFRRR